MINEIFITNYDYNFKNCTRTKINNQNIYLSNNFKKISDDIFIVFNGYFNNIDEYFFNDVNKDVCLEEKIYYLFKKFDNKILSYLEGVFSIVIIYSGKIIFFRDPLGCDNIYYSYDKINNHFIISSKIEELIKYKSISINRKELIKYFITADINKYETLIEDIFVPQRMEIIKIDLNKNINLIKDEEIESNLKFVNINDTEIIKKIDELIKESIRKIIKTKNKNTIVNSFSGGLDSSYIQFRLLDNNISKSFTVNFENYGSAKERISHFLKIHQVENFLIDIDVTEFIDNILNGIKITKMPFMFSGEPMMLKLYKTINKYYDDTEVYCFDGLFADAILGYMRILFELKYISKYRSFFKIVNKCIIKHFSKDIYSRYNSIIDIIDNDFIGQKEYIELFFKKNLKSVFKIINLDKSELEGIFDREVNEINNSNLSIQEKIYRYIAYELDNRRIVNTRTALAKHLKVNLVYPFIDKKFNEFYQNIPYERKVGFTINGLQSKILFKKMLLLYFPSSFVFKSKISGGIPTRELIYKNPKIKSILDEISKTKYSFMELDKRVLGDLDSELFYKIINIHLWHKELELIKQDEQKRVN